MAPLITNFYRSVLLTCLLSQIAFAGQEEDRDFLAKVASVSPKGVAAGMATINGISMPILVFLHESSLEAFQAKVKATFQMTHILIPQKTAAATGFLLVPQKPYPCATCTAAQLGTLAATVSTATTFTWIETPDVHLAFASPLSSVATAAVSTDKALEADLMRLLPGARLLHAESMDWAGKSTASLVASLPWNTREASQFWKKHYESNGWASIASSSSLLVFQKGAAVVHLTFEPTSPNTTRMSRHEVR